MKEDRFPPGWDEERVRKVLFQYEKQSEEEAVAEDEAAFEEPGDTAVEVPYELMPKIRQLLAQYKAAKKDS